MATMGAAPYYTAPPLAGRNVQGARVLAVLQMVFGFMLAILEIIGLGMALSRMDTMTATGAGIWAGGLFIATGIAGVMATRANPANVSRKGLFTTFMGLSIFCSIMSVGMIVFSVISLVIGSVSHYNSSYPYYYGSSSSYGSSYYSTASNFFYFNQNAFLGIRIFSLFLYFSQFIFFIISAAFGCCNVCTSDRPTAGVVYHVGQPQPQQYYAGPPQPQFMPGNANFNNMHGVYVHPQQFQSPPQYNGQQEPVNYAETSKRGG